MRAKTLQCTLWRAYRAWRKTPSATSRSSTRLSLQPQTCKIFQWLWLQAAPVTALRLPILVARLTARKSITIKWSSKLQTQLFRCRPHHFYNVCKKPAVCSHPSPRTCLQLNLPAKKERKHWCWTLMRPLYTLHLSQWKILISPSQSTSRTSLTRSWARKFTLASALTAISSSKPWRLTSRSLCLLPVCKGMQSLSSKSWTQRSVYLIHACIASTAHITRESFTLKISLA